MRGEEPVVLTVSVPREAVAIYGTAMPEWEGLEFIHEVLLDERTPFGSVRMEKDAADEGIFVNDEDPSSDGGELPDMEVRRGRDQEAQAVDATGTGERIVKAEVSVAGLVVRAADTGRVLMLQRALTEDDPAAGMWEFPGGHLNPGEDPLEGAMREWCEETGHTVPEGRVVGDWVACNEIYRGFVYEVPSEGDVSVIEDRDNVANPDDPGGDQVESLAWWDVDQLADNPAIRRELLADMGTVLSVLTKHGDGSGWGESHTMGNDRTADDASVEVDVHSVSPPERESEKDERGSIMPRESGPIRLQVGDHDAFNYGLGFARLFNRGIRDRRFKLALVKDDEGDRTTFDFD